MCKALFNVMCYIIILNLSIFLISFSVNCVFLDNLREDDYVGEKFPNQYLDAEEELPTALDLTHYLGRLRKTVDIIGSHPNEIDLSLALTMFLVKALLKRTIQDYEQKMYKLQSDTAKHIINVADNYVSHFVNISQPYGWSYIPFKLSQIYKDDAPLVYSIGDFNRNRLKKWLTGRGKLNNFTKEFDEATLSKGKYVKLAEAFDKNSAYSISISDSDWCLSYAVYHDVPARIENLQPCRPYPYCMKKIQAAPSVAYTLSHRLLNMIFLRLLRRCYILSDVEDKDHIDMLCASMYRETVYLARRGYFYRDIFLEHIALCGLIGYQEFHRRQWFNKAISWMDKAGCMQENANVEQARTQLQISGARDPKKVNDLRKRLRRVLLEECQNHPMAVLVSALANGVRYAAHFMKT